MTLVVAAAEADGIWMVSDSAVTNDPKLSVRDRRYIPKVEASIDRQALMAFAGNDAVNAARIIRLARQELGGPDGLSVLRRESAANINVEFAYAFFQDGRPLLFRVFGGHHTLSSTFHIGNTSAFKTFQRIRHGEVDPYAKMALKTFMAATKAKGGVPERLAKAIYSMIDLFAMRVETDVGGWAVPYVLGQDGAHFCAYGYGVSDPIFDTLPSHSIVPHGTPERGGSSLSVTELPDEKGMVVYRLQMLGGWVLVRSADGEYEQHSVRGSPSEFKDRVESAIGQRPDLWTGDQPAGPIRALKVVRGVDGKINIVVGDHGGSFTYVAINRATPFDSELDMENQNGPPSGDSGPFQVDISTDRQSVAITSSGNNPLRVELGAAELSALIQRLGLFRDKMADPVPTRPIGETLALLDPAWQTERSPHPAINGTLLSLRHNGFGWLSFILPNHEALAIGKWLIENSAVPEATPKTGSE